MVRQTIEPFDIRGSAGRCRANRALAVTAIAGPLLTRPLRPLGAERGSVWPCHHRPAPSRCVHAVASSRPQPGGEPGSRKRRDSWVPASAGTTMKGSARDPGLGCPKRPLGPAGEAAPLARLGQPAAGEPRPKQRFVDCAAHARHGEEPTGPAGGRPGDRLRDVAIQRRLPPRVASPAARKDE